MKKKKRKLKPQVKRVLDVILIMITGALIGIALYQLMTEKTTHETPVGSYECRGKIIQVCSGSKEVANYLGA